MPGSFDVRRCLNPSKFSRARTCWSSKLYISRKCAILVRASRCECHETFWVKWVKITIWCFRADARKGFQRVNVHVLPFLPPVILKKPETRRIVPSPNDGTLLLHQNDSYCPFDVRPCQRFIDHQHLSPLDREKCIPCLYRMAKHYIKGFDVSRIENSGCRLCLCRVANHCSRGDRPLWNRCGYREERRESGRIVLPWVLD